MVGDMLMIFHLSYEMFFTYRHFNYSYRCDSRKGRAIGNNQNINKPFQIRRGFFVGYYDNTKKTYFTKQYNKERS